MAVVHVNTENFETEVVKSDVPVIIDFFADWCMPCRMMAPEFEALSKEYTDTLKFAKVNTDENGELSNKFGVEGIPCLILTKGGKEIDRIVGFSPRDVLKRKIDSLL